MWWLNRFEPVCTVTNFGARPLTLSPLNLTLCNTQVELNYYKCTGEHTRTYEHRQSNSHTTHRSCSRCGRASPPGSLSKSGFCNHGSLVQQVWAEATIILSFEFFKSGSNRVQHPHDDHALAFDAWLQILRPTEIEPSIFHFYDVREYRGLNPACEHELRNS